MSPTNQVRITLACAALLAATADAAAAQSIARISVSSTGVQGNADSSPPSLTADGHWAVFDSLADDLVPGDTNGCSDIFVRDLWAGTTERVSVAPNGDQSNGGSGLESLSSDGRFVVFASTASNLVLGDTNGRQDVFVLDRITGAIDRVSVSTAGVEADSDCHVSVCVPVISTDGRFVVFDSHATNLVLGDSNGSWDSYLHDRITGTTDFVDRNAAGEQANARSTGASLTPDGRHAVFTSQATNLVGHDVNGLQDVFVRDLSTGVVELVSVSSTGEQGDGISFQGMLTPDGRFVCFGSAATNLVAGDVNGEVDVFVHDRLTGVTELVSVASDGTQGDGRSGEAVISSDGRFVAFDSIASTLVPSDTNATDDVFLHDRLTRGTLRITGGGVQGNGPTDHPTITTEGRRIGFRSGAKNLVPGDTNRATDAFVVDRGAALIASYCVASTTSAGCVPAIGSSGEPSLSGSAPFELRAAPVINRKFGLLSYGFAPSTPPFHAGLACIAAPLERTRPVYSGGNPPPDDCSGALELDFNPIVRSGVDPNLVAGREVFCQFWFRDRASASGAGMSDALTFVIQP
ncbi:MAG: calcium-binding protein [Planctomycetes bacterium]|nr:calcium-binding protein [Planctomycetota bacterium]